MIFVDAKTKLKYNTDKMELISCKCKIRIRFGIVLKAKIYKSKKGNWLGVAKWTDGTEEAKTLSKDEVKRILLSNDVEAYEKVFGKLKEA